MTKPCPACGRRNALPDFNSEPARRLQEEIIGRLAKPTPVHMTKEEIRDMFSRARSNTDDFVVMSGDSGVEIRERMMDRFCRICGVHLGDEGDFKRMISDAQSGENDGRLPTFEDALQELTAGRKVSHWIWYVFPQILLGSSQMARRYAVPNRNDVTQMLDDENLGGNYRAAVDAVAHHVLDTGGDRLAWAALVDLMGSRLDAKKFVSSITLFGEISRIAGQHLDVAERLDRFVAAGIRPCSSTLDAIVAGEV
ncbi:MAG: hypothetical protein RLY50_556 [Actinomycetota bacterium]